MKPIIQKLQKLKLNALDFFVIAIVLLILGSFLWLRVSKKTEWVTVRLVIGNDEWWWEGQPPQWWYVDNLQAGLTAKSSFGENNAEITNVESFDIGGFRRRAFVDIKLKGAFDKNRQVYLYNYQPLQIGKPLDLTFGKYNVKGLIAYIDKGQMEYKDRRIEVRALKIHPWEAESLMKGLEMKDTAGRVLATVENVQVDTSIEYEFSDIRGQTIPVANPGFRDVTLRLAIKTFESGGTEHFIDRAAIKVGEKIWFQFPRAAIRDAEITKVFE